MRKRLAGSILLSAILLVGCGKTVEEQVDEGMVKVYEEEEQFLLKSVRFSKELEGAKLLKLVGESRTSTVLVRYTLQ